MDDPQHEKPESVAPEYLNILVANAPLAMAMFDRDMRYLVANKLWIDEFHLEEISIKGASHYEIFPDLHESWREVYDRCLEGHVERCEEDIFQRPDGSRDWVRWEVRPWRHQAGEIGGLIISCEVMTERKRAEQRMQFEKDFTEGLLAGASPVVVVDLEGRIGRSSEGARALCGGGEITDGETYFWDVFSDDDQRGEVAKSFLSEIERQGENGTFSFPNSTVSIYTDKGGKRRKITWTNTAQKNDHGVVDRIIRIGFETPIEEEKPVAEVPVADVQTGESVSEEEAGVESKTEESLVPEGVVENDADAVGEEATEAAAEPTTPDAEILAEKDRSDESDKEDDAEGEAEDDVEGASAEISTEDERPEWGVESEPFADEEAASEERAEDDLKDEETADEGDSEAAPEPDPGTSLRELAEKVRAARGAAARATPPPVTGGIREGGDEEDVDFLVGQPFAPSPLRQGPTPEGDENEGFENAKPEPEGAETEGEESGDAVAALGFEEHAFSESDDESVAESDAVVSSDDSDSTEAVEEDEEPVTTAKEDGGAEEEEAEDSELGEEASAAELVRLAVAAEDSIGTASPEAVSDEETEDDADEGGEVAELEEEPEPPLAGALPSEPEILTEAEEAEPEDAIEDDDVAEAATEAAAESEEIQESAPSKAEAETAASEAEASRLVKDLSERIARLETDIQQRLAAAPSPSVPLPPNIAQLKSESAELEQDDAEEKEEALSASVEEEEPEESVTETEDEPFVESVDSSSGAHEQAAENLPFGLLLLDEELEVVYSNPKLTSILGFGMDEAGGVEAWIRRGCPDEAYAEEVLTEWRNAVWRRQLTKTFTLSDSAGALREIEFRPNLLEDGRLLLTVLDVTDSRRSEEALRSSEAKFRALFQDSGVGIALVDQTGDIFDVNPAMEALLGAKRPDLRMEAFDEQIDPEDLEEVQKAVSAVMDGGERAAEITARLSQSGGEQVWTRLNIVVVRDPDGEPMFTAYFAHDISEQRRATKELEESQVQNRALLEATPDLLFLIDTKGTIEDYICSLDFPIKVGESVVGSDLRKVVPQLRITLDEQLERVADTDKVVKSQFSAGGHRFETRLVQSGDEHRVMVLRDQTEMLARREAPHRNPGAFELMDDAVISVDNHGTVTEWNSAATELFGLPRADALGQKLAEIYGIEDSAAFWKSLREAVGSDGVWGMERLAFGRRDGTTGECSVRFAPLELDESSQPISLIGVHGDLTKAEGGEAEAPSGLVAPEAVYQKITNNLQIIYSLLNLQVNTLEDPKARATLMASQNRVRAISFVHQQLKEVGGGQQVDFAGFVDMLANHLRQAYGTPPEQVGVRIGFSDVYLPVEPSIPLALVLNELLSNALRHGFSDGEKGEVGIDLKVDGGLGTLTVRDTGSGLPEGDFDSIKGLGLQIASTLVQQVGGSLAPKSGPDTSFVVEFKI